MDTVILDPELVRQSFEAGAVVYGTVWGVAMVIRTIFLA